MLCLAYQYGEDPDHNDEFGSGSLLSERCFHKALAALVLDEEAMKDSAETVSLVQAYLLVQVCAMMYLCGDNSSHGLKAHSKMISLARDGGLMGPTPAESSPAKDLDSLWRSFAIAESRKRTLFAAHQIDTLLYQFLSIPRQLSHLEIKHELPCPEGYWTASSAVEWAHQQLVSERAGSSLRYPEAIRRFISSDAPDLSTIPAFDAYGAVNITHFLVSSAQEISGWCTMTGMLSIERLEPLRSSLLALSPFIRASPNSKEAMSSKLCEGSWEAAMIDVQMWSPSHTGGIVGKSMDAVLHQLTYLAPTCEFLCESRTAKVIQPHVDWFLSYLDTTPVPDSEAPWITVYAYKAFMIAWKLVSGGALGSMRIVGIQDGDLEGALAWARTVFGRRQRRQIGRIILTCLDTLTL
ncbi:complex I intermediate-associated protein 30 [Purpureocillium lavendulum]|uniref:Complex I intermediate-associated protein 30 n=1 Tax=Purpureocillium lavendulum TaxID=1247861 RepID=A0AB34FXX1_9HYPO|nr:complex I intermediate-associated protein 30 [Purpureocillium lavendulum]